MKITKVETLGIIAALLTVAGCAHRASYTSYDERISSPAYSGTSYDNRSTTYNSSVRATTESPTYNNNTSVNQTYLGPTGQPAPKEAASTSDQTLIVQVRQALNNNPNLTEIVPNIQVTANNGVINLVGTVPNEQQKQAVETAVKSTTGVVNINNQLQVSLSPTSSKSSDKISRIYSNGASQAPSAAGANQNGSSSSVSNRIDNSSHGLPPTSDRPDQEPRLYSTNNTGLSVSPQASIGTSERSRLQGPSENKSLTASADTTQSGTLYSNGPSSRAVSAAVNQSSPLTPTSDRQSSRIYSNAPSVASTPESSSQVGLSATTAASSDQTQSEHKELSPTSASSSENRRYSQGTESTAASVPGSAGSFDIKVTGASQMDQSLGQKIISQLRADTSLAAARPTLRISIDNGKATLRGTVKSQDEKQKIETDVQKVTGVTSVDNQLRIGTAPKDTDRAP